MQNPTFLDDHRQLTRRFFQKFGLSAAALASLVELQPAPAASPEKKADKKAGASPEPYFTPVGAFQDVSRGTPVPHTLTDEKKRDAGLTSETWRLNVISDPQNPARILNERSEAKGNPIDFQELVQLGQKHGVRFAKVMTCLNMGCPLGMGLWEGVPLREIIWQTRPRDNLRRVYYHGFHNNDPKQLFRSSLPIGRVLEEPGDLPPVILCYKLNGQWLDSVRGGPVRLVVPEDYGFKSIKWLTHIYLSNLAHANDTYAEQNNDVESPLKTFAASLSVPLEVKPGQPIPVSGYAQVGISGLKSVEISVEPNDKPWPENDPYFLNAQWKPATILPPPDSWNSLEHGKIPPDTHGFDPSGRPKTWPMRLTNAHWAALLPGLPAGEYTFRCRSIDTKGQAQPMPRPFRKSGHSAIESLVIRVRA